MKNSKKNLETDQDISPHQAHDEYVAPDFVTEELMTFGALCNGTNTGGRKSAVGAPSFCNSSRINS